MNNALWTDVGESRATLPERQERAFLVALEDKHVGVMVTANGDDLACRAVPSPNPDYLGRVPQQEAPLVEIGILRDDREPCWAAYRQTVSSSAACRSTSRTCDEPG